MKYQLGLVHDGAIVGRSDAVIHAGSEATHELTEKVAGVGNKGDRVRKSHPLEDPTVSHACAADAAKGVKLALLLDGEDGTEVVAAFGDSDHAAALGDFGRRLSALEADKRTRDAAAALAATHGGKQ